MASTLTQRRDIPCMIPLPDTWLEDVSARHKEELANVENNLCHSTAKTSAHCCLDHLQKDTIFSIYRDLEAWSKHAATDLMNSDLDLGAPDVPPWVNVIIHRLLSVRPMELMVNNDEYGAAVIEEVQRLGMLLYLAPVWRFYGAFPAFTKVIVRKIHELLKTQKTARLWEREIYSVRIWVLCMSAFETSALYEEHEDSSWFVQALAGILGSDCEPIDIAKRVLWLPRLFDISARRLDGRLKEELQRSQHSPHAE